MAPKLSETQEKLVKALVTPEFPKNPYEVLGELDFIEPQVIPKSKVGTPVQEFYRDTTIFITGGTGFLGKTLIEKLLRSCPHVKHLYLLVREKKGKSAHQRLDDIFEDPIFKRLKYEVPKYYEKVSIVTGNVQDSGLGLADVDRRKLIEEVNIIFHGAATVRFDEKIAQAFRVNVLGTRRVIELAKEVKKLKLILHVSTAYSFCTRKEITEQIYPMHIHYTEILKMMETMSDDEIESQKLSLYGPYPNSYTFAKGSAETLVQAESKNLPICIFRPAIVISTYREPVRGWIDNMYGPMGLLIGMGTGVIHVGIVNMDETHVPNMVPVDFVANGMLCAAKESFEIHKTKKDPEIPIYNFAKETKDLPTWTEFMKLSMEPLNSWAAKDSVWYYSVVATPNMFIYSILTTILHTFCGYILDGLLKFQGKPARLSSIYKRFHNGIDILRFFIKGLWTFKKENLKNLWNNLTPEDQELFFFNLEAMDWGKYMHSLVLGIRVYLLKDGVETVEASRAKWKKLRTAHLILVSVFYFLVLYALFYFVIQFVVAYGQD